MTKIISTHSFRGGTGKSNITANLAATLAKSGFRVGIFDGDIQSPGIHIIFGLEESRIEHTLNHYLWGNCSIKDATYTVHEHPSGGKVYLVPSSIKPNDIARILREKYDANDMHKAFRNLITECDLDFLLIDTHPGLNEETLLSVAISDMLIIVLRPDQQDFQGTSVTVDIARRLQVPNVQLVVNKTPPDYDFEDIVKKVELTYDAPVAAILPLSLDLAQNASGSVFCLENPVHEFSQGVQRVADITLAIINEEVAA